MSEAPIVYLLHGDDHYAMQEFVHAVQEKLGDPSTADMNTTRLEDRYDFNQLVNAASAIPFLAPRRLVVVYNVTSKFKTKDEQEKMTTYMGGLPQSTALVILENKPLKKGNWLYKWAAGQAGHCYTKEYSVPKGVQLQKWIQNYTQKQGGQINPQAASLLGELSGDSPQMAAIEIEKLLAYVNYARPIEMDDVDLLAAFVSGGGDFFKLIDAIGARNSRLAMDMLQKLLDEQDPLMLFFSLVGQYRLLLQTREVIENGGNDDSVAKELGIHPFRAKKLTAQARQLKMSNLKTIYRELSETDFKIKTGQVLPQLALEVFVAELTV